jgi:hypothetical protein
LENNKRERNHKLIAHPEGQNVGAFPEDSVTMRKILELFFVEFQGSGIDAVAQTRGARAVVKDMA